MWVSMADGCSRFVLLLIGVAPGVNAGPGDVGAEAREGKTLFEDPR